MHTSPHSVWCIHSTLFLGTLSVSIMLPAFHNAGDLCLDQCPLKPALSVWQVRKYSGAQRKNGLGETQRYYNQFALTIPYHLYLPGIQSCSNSLKLITVILHIIKTIEKKIIGSYKLIFKKVFNKIQHLFMIKILRKIRREGTSSN